MKRIFPFVIASIIAEITSAQVVAWTKHVPRNNGVVTYSPGLSMDDQGNAYCLTDAIPYEIRSFDWSGAPLDTIDPAQVNFLKPVQGGHLVTGSFNQNISIGGLELETNDGQIRSFLVKLGPDMIAEWSVVGIPVGTGSVYVQSMGVSPSGRCALLLRVNGTVQWSGLQFTGSLNDRFLLVLDESGEAQWFKWIRTAQGHNVLNSQFIQTAISDAGDVWLSTYYSSTLVVGNDTLPAAGISSYDHFTLHLDANGDLAGLLHVPSLPDRFGLYCTGIVPHIDGTAIWVGGFHDGANLNGAILNGNGHTEALLLHLQNDAQPGQILRGYSDLGSGFGDIARDPVTGDLIIIGSAHGHLTFGDQEIDMNTYSYTYAIQLTADGIFGPFIGLTRGQNNVRGNSSYVSNAVIREGIAYVLGYVGWGGERWDGTNLPEGLTLSRIIPSDRVGIHEAVLGATRIRPVPAADFILVDGTWGSGPVRMIDAQGRTMTVQPSGMDGTLRIDIQHLPAGSYNLVGEHGPMGRFVKM